VIRAYRVIVPVKRRVGRRFLEKNGPGFNQFTFTKAAAHNVRISIGTSVKTIPQYVITLAGVLEFTTVGGETFTIHPGDVLLAEDHTGSGHKWRLINDDPWKRAYVVFKEGANTHFVPDSA